uniref:Uncharacterized protein n=1 Tax=Helianthus annuus TaxID=4232 RepID=A0A251V7W6_HELAN
MDPSLASACTNSQQLRDLPLSNEKRDVTSTTTLSLNKDVRYGSDGGFAAW